MLIINGAGKQLTAQQADYTAKKILLLMEAKRY
jgi:hypothetical protein